jgi:hypothetical protein
LDKIEKTLKKASKKSKKCHYEDSDCNSEQGVGLGSTRKEEINLGETVKKTKFTPPSPMKATPTNIASNTYDVCSMLVSDADDVMLTSPSQNKKIHVNDSILPKKDPPEGKTTAVIAVMRGKPKDSYHCHHSNKTTSLN